MIRSFSHPLLPRPLSFHLSGRRQKGAVLIEIAIIAPVLVLLVVGMIRFGIGQIERANFDRAVNDLSEVAAYSNDLDADAEGLEAIFQISSWPVVSDVADPNYSLDKVRLRIHRFRYDAPTASWDRVSDQAVDYGALPDDRSVSRVTDGSRLQPTCPTGVPAGQCPHNCDPATDHCIAELVDDPVDDEAIIVVEAWREDGLFANFTADFTAPRRMYSQAAQLHRDPPNPIILYRSTAAILNPDTRQTVDAHCDANRPTGLLCPDPVAFISFADDAPREGGGAGMRDELVSIPQNYPWIADRRPIHVWRESSGEISVNPIADTWADLFTPDIDGNFLSQSINDAGDFSLPPHPDGTPLNAFWSHSGATGTAELGDCALNNLGGPVRFGNSDLRTLNYLQNDASCDVTAALLCVCMP